MNVITASDLKACLGFGIKFDTTRREGDGIPIYCADCHASIKHQIMLVCDQDGVLIARAYPDEQLHRFWPDTPLPVNSVVHVIAQHLVEKAAEER